MLLVFVIRCVAVRTFRFLIDLNLTSSLGKINVYLFLCLCVDWLTLTDQNSKGICDDQILPDPVLRTYRKIRMIPALILFFSLN